MKYKVTYEKKAIKSLSKVNKRQGIIILAWIEKNLVDTKNPRKKGEAFNGNKKDYWRYKVGNYRLLADISKEQKKIVLFNLGHKRETNP